MAGHQAGTVLGERFELVELLGEGAFGAVYRARQRVFGQTLREVAIKLFKADSISSDNVREVFHDAIILAGLQEEIGDVEVARRLVQVYDLGLIGEQAFISMKLVPGRLTLQTAIRRWKDRMPVETALHFLRQMLIPLAWMHTLDTPAVHGDLKPDNVLMTPGTSDLILTDFGLSARLPLGALGGAIAYQSAEQLRLGLIGRSGGVASTTPDIFSVGIILYELLTGAHPYQVFGLGAEAADDERALLEAHYASRRLPMLRSDEAPDDQRIIPPSEINPEVRAHPQVEAMVARCLAFDPARRYPNAKILLSDVDRYLQAGRTRGTSVPVAPRAPVANPSTSANGKTVAALIDDASVLLETGNVDKALALAEEAVRRQPKSLAATLFRAKALAGRLRTLKDGPERRTTFDAARQVCMEAGKLDRHNPDVVGATAEVLEALGAGADEVIVGMAKALREEERRLRFPSKPTAGGVTRER